MDGMWTTRSHQERSGMEGRRAGEMHGEQRSVILIGTGLIKSDCPQEYCKSNCTHRHWVRNTGRVNERKSRREKRGCLNWLTRSRKNGESGERRRGQRGLVFVDSVLFPCPGCAVPSIARVKRGG